MLHAFAVGPRRVSLLLINVAILLNPTDPAAKQLLVPNGT
jgi:hypothetical protein